MKLETLGSLFFIIYKNIILSMKSLLSVINEVLTKKLKEGTPLTELAIGKTLFTQRGSKKFLNVEAIEKDFKNIESVVKNLKNTTQQT